ncbi:MAG: 4-alpha-glucanotransferase, partial [Gemmatimonadota bacterium]|nr:4-alpha-glucanotransferase [Gemmatimonadota bacterium]
LDAAQRTRLLEPVRVLPAGAPAPTALRARGAGEWFAELRFEDGAARTLHGVLAPGSGAVPLPDALPVGYHDLHVSVRDEAGAREATQRLIVAPERCAEAPRPARHVGVLANLYTVRSAANWGCGDLGDLRALADWARRAGASFVGINPLHATRNRGLDVSPYHPTSRLFRNPIYVDVTAVPEFADSPDAAALVAAPGFAAAREALRAAPLVDYEGVMRLKRAVLEALHRTFGARHRGRGTPRALAYDEYRRRLGEPLERFAVFCALSDRMTEPGGTGPLADWHDWPPPLRDPASPAVADFARAHADVVDFHRWLQFVLDEQLADAGRGLPLGVYCDLAVGSAPGGCDTWTWPALFARDAAIGAPPDDFAADGQNWGLPPIAPHALRDDRYRYWIRLLRAGFARGGMLRLDHVMGLFRLYWVPAGHSPRDGAYVRYPADDLLAILALESRRHDAPVVGENLGTVPPEVGPAMERWGLLGSAVTYFAYDDEGEFRAARAYPAQALVTAGTHDHVPLAGFWSGRDIEIHRAIGLIQDDRATERARALRARARDALVRRVAGGAAIADAAGFVRAVHAFLGRTPSALVGVALDDLALETDPVNIPGTANDRYPNWQRKMHRTLDQLAGAESAASLAAAVNASPDGA